MFPAKWFVFALCLTVASVPAASAKDIEQIDVNETIAGVIVSVIRPAFGKLAQDAHVMSQSLDAYCSAPTGRGLAEVRDRFDALALSWGRVEFIRPGPLSAENRLERMLFWPDRRGRGLKQVRDVIRLEDEAALDPDLLVQKSVAVQGLLALEYVLFSDNAEVGLSVKNGFRCAYASAIASRVEQLTAELNVLWLSDDENSVSQVWQNPSPTNALYRDEVEQFSALLGMLEDGFEIILHQRLQPVLRDDIATAKPKSALFWRSENSIPVLNANLAGLNAIIESAGLAQQVTGDERRTIASLNFEFGNAFRTLSMLDMPPEEIVSEDSSYDRLVYIEIVVESMLAIVRDQIKPMFGLSSGFSSLDGD
jgi:predicted lipoprotein